MRKSSVFLFLLAFFALPFDLNAQEHKPPLPVEILFGNDHMYFEMVVIKPFAPDSRLGFFSVATFTAKYDDFQNVDITIPAHLYYNFWKGFSAVGGGKVNSVAGFSPYVGFQHNFASRQFVAVTIASFNLNSSADFEIFGLYEYTPPINDKWSFYSRLQFIYNTSLTEGTHNRSYLYLRAGIKRESLIFGLGANLDQYGPYKDFEGNYGLFVRYEL